MLVRELEGGAIELRGTEEELLRARQLTEDDRLGRVGRELAGLCTLVRSGLHGLSRSRAHEWAESGIVPL